MKKIFPILLMLLCVSNTFSQVWKPVVKENIPLDSIRLSDLAILADKNTSTYYMTGTGGMLWKNKDLAKWTGPRVQEKEPIIPPNFGHGILFRTFQGKLIMSTHSHKSVNGRTIRIPHLFEVDDSGDKLVVKGQYYP